MLDPAGGTRPLPSRQIKGVEEMAASITAFRAGVPAVHLDQGAPISGRLVLQLAHEPASARIVDGFGQRMIAHQVFDSQRLDTDHLVLADQVRRQSMEATSA